MDIFRNEKIRTMTLTLVTKPRNNCIKYFFTAERTKIKHFHWYLLVTITFLAG